MSAYKTNLVEAVGPLQQGLRHVINHMPRYASFVEAVGPLQQGLRQIVYKEEIEKLNRRSSRSTTTGIATSIWKFDFQNRFEGRSSRSTTTGIATLISTGIPYFYPRSKQ